MRLINANELMEKIVEYDNKNIQSPNRGTIADVIDTISEMITEQPIAYDIDKVVEQLEKEYENAEHEWEETGDPHYNGEAIAFVRAIEIVKKGGAV